MLDITPACGTQRYSIANGQPQLVQTVHQLRPAQGDTDAEFLARVLADLARAASCTAELILHWRDARIANAEIVLSPPPAPSPAQPQNPPEH